MQKKGIQKLACNHQKIKTSTARAHIPQVYNLSQECKSQKKNLTGLIICMTQIAACHTVIGIMPLHSVYWNMGDQTSFV